ncbi:MAG: YheV family putative metal-binding protein [Halieaceae bacterium]|nr:YheV family putative metal-binding protein [Halieaceae bacterium]
MTASTGRRRFIAGAVCPRCAKMDKIVVDLDTDQRECIACGFSEARPGMPATEQTPPHSDATTELPTRVSRAAARRVETPAEPVRLLDPRKEENE